jgi:hypothetical protein
VNVGNSSGGATSVTTGAIVQGQGGMLNTQKVNVGNN